MEHSTETKSFFTRDLFPTGKKMPSLVQAFRPSSKTQSTHTKATKILTPVVKFLKKYHQHEVIGIEKIPEKGRAIIATNHSLATYDIALLVAEVLFKRERLIRPLVGRLFYELPFLGSFMDATGAVLGSPENAKRILANDELLGVAPGGMLESLRPSSERYQLRWDNRLGFAKLAIETGTPVILAACPRADDIFQVYSSPLTSWAYRQFRVPLFVARGLGLSALPRPVKLAHMISDPIKPPPPAPTRRGLASQTKVFQRQLKSEMEKLIGQAIAHRSQQLPSYLNSNRW